MLPDAILPRCNVGGGDAHGSLFRNIEAGIDGGSIGLPTLVGRPARELEVGQRLLHGEVERPMVSRVSWFVSTLHGFRHRIGLEFVDLGRDGDVADREIVIQRAGGTEHYEKTDVGIVQQLLRAVLRRQKAHAAE